MSLQEKRIHLQNRERTFQFHEKYNLSLPNEWIDPFEITQVPPGFDKENISALPLLSRPYYKKILEDYVSWMRQPHATLANFDWGERLTPIYNVLDPTVQEDGRVPTTGFIYEALYSFLAGMATDQIPPRQELGLERAEELKNKILVNTLELMSFVQKLETRKVAFDLDINQTGHPLGYIKEEINLRGDRGARSQVKIRGSFFNIYFNGKKEDLHLDYDMLNPFRYGIRITDDRSFGAGFMLDHNRSAEDERKLCLDMKIKQVRWGMHVDGSYRPIGDENLLHEYLGENVHHIPLVTEVGIGGPSQVIAIKRAVVEELGLSPLMDAIKQPTEVTIERQK
jgi:hypothetical protein